MLNKKDLSSGELETLRRSRNPHCGGHGQRGSADEQGSTFFVRGLRLFVAMQSLEDTPAILQSEKFYEEHAYTNEWTSGQKPLQD